MNVELHTKSKPKRFRKFMKNNVQILCNSHKRTTNKKMQQADCTKTMDNFQLISY